MMQSQKFELKLTIRVFKDGDEWYALIGEDLQSGIAGCDKTPVEALNVLFTHFANLPSIDVLADELMPFTDYEQPTNS
ncbi:hypothetical protein [Chroococcidiopsis sp.]|uniref:hypothetical protein n=1 Tax=Chroococcidiopsis sp. TaxID=3088168 RepID=UPI003F3C3C62